ncbi:MAG: exodeoxyribonuclease VII small subunit [Clostridia bacterium]|nr:exodeoxyribonuclease VII small subunit [Clostridia bacterium]
MAAKKKKTLSFEEGMDALEAMIGRLGEAELPLEESIALYEQGVALCAQLEQELAQKRRRIGQIDPETGEVEPFEAS